MARRIVTLYFALVSLLFVATGAFADSLQFARQQGTFTTDTRLAVNVNVNVTQYTFTGLEPQVSGTIGIIGVSGQNAVSINAEASSIQFSTVAISGRNYKQAVINSRPFYFIDLRTGRRSLATSTTVVTQYGRGMIRYYIYNMDDGSIVTGSIMASGNTGAVALNSGSTSILP